MPQRRRPPTEWRRIRDLFRRRRDCYGVGEVAARLGIEEATVRRAIGQGELTVSGAGGELRICWEDVLTLGLEHRWTVRMLTAALRGTGRAGDGLPPLVRTVPGRIVLPRYQWQILRLLAEHRARSERREITVSDLVEEAVTAAVLMSIEDWASIEASLPGVRAADAWPSAD